MHAVSVATLFAQLGISPWVLPLIAVAAKRKEAQLREAGFGPLLRRLKARAEAMIRPESRKSSHVTLALRLRSLSPFRGRGPG